MTDLTPAPSFWGALANVRAVVLREQLDLAVDHPLQPLLTALDRALAGEDLRDCDGTAIATVEAASQMTDQQRAAVGLGYCFDPGASVLERIAWSIRLETAHARACPEQTDEAAPWGGMAMFGTLLEGFVAGLDGEPFVSEASF